MIWRDLSLAKQTATNFDLQSKMRAALQTGFAGTGRRRADSYRPSGADIDVLENIILDTEQYMSRQILSPLTAQLLKSALP